MASVQANGVNIFYQERGHGDPLLLIMGLGADGTLWEEHVLAFEKHFRCILMDNRGAGKSDKPEGPYTTATMAADCAGLLGALNIERAHIAGISMGSAIAQELALAHPELIKSLVLISSWARCDRYTQTVFENFARVRASVDASVFTQLLQLWIFTPGHFDTHFDELLEGQQPTDEKPPMPQHAFQAQCAACAGHDTLERLSEITAPAIITVGDSDIFTPVRFSEEIAERLPQAELVLFPGCGHCHHWEDLDAFNARITEFLLKH